MDMEDDRLMAAHRLLAAFEPETGGAPTDLC
jgi:hypothetical protein